VTTWLDTAFQAQFRVIGALKSFAERARRELLGTVSKD
jgi:hypothetical protein